MKINKQFVIRAIMGENILVPCGDTAMDFNGLITLNDTAADIWGMLPEAADEDDIVRRMLEIYDADEATLRADVAEFMGKLREAGIID